MTINIALLTELENELLPVYSYLSAAIGSIFVARRAGM